MRQGRRGAGGEAKQDKTPFCPYAEQKVLSIHYFLKICVRICTCRRLPLVTPLPMTQQEFLDAYDLYADAIFRHCALRLGDREDGKDLMQDTFIRAWEAIVGGIVVENMRAYLYRIANNLIIDIVRRRKRRPTSSLEEMMEVGFNPVSREKGPAAAFEERFVLEALQHIEEPYRTAVILRFIDELQPREIAALLDVSPNVVSVRVNRGVQKLQSLLSPHG